MDTPIEGFEVKPWCETHQKMGRWMVVYYYEDLGDGILGVVDNHESIVCEDC